MFTAKELERIITLSSKKGVSELTIGDIHLKFGRSFEENKQIFPTNISQEKINKAAISSIEDEEYDIRQEQIAKMIIEDPEGYEKLLEEGELEDAKL